jgi:Sel1 repeat
MRAISTSRSSRRRLRPAAEEPPPLNAKGNRPKNRVLEHRKCVRQADAHDRHIPINVRRTDWRVVALATTALLLGGPLVHADDALPTGTNELRSVAEKGDPAAQLCLGIRYYAGWHKDPTRIAEAEKWFRLSAAQGNAQAEEHLGQLYYLGRDQSPDYPEAVAWFRKAAEHGNREAQLRLAQMYREGKGVAVDRDEAKKWSDLAAQFDNISFAHLQL